MGVSKKKRKIGTFTKLVSYIVSVGEIFIEYKKRDELKNADTKHSEKDENIVGNKTDVVTERVASNTYSSVSDDTLEIDLDDDPDFGYSPEEVYERYRRHIASTTLYIQDVKNLKGTKVNVFAESAGIFNADINDSSTLLDVVEPGDYECIFEYKRNRHTQQLTGSVLCLVHPETYKYFFIFEDLDSRASNISNFADCSPDIKDFILKNAQKEIVEENEEELLFSNTKEVLTDSKALQTMFSLCENSLSPELRVKCKSLIKEMRGGSKSSKDAGMVLSDILHTCLEDVDGYVEPPSYEECVTILRKYHHGDDELIEGIARQIRLLARNRTTGTVFVLLGPPGTGKSSLAKGIAECLHLIYISIPCKNKSPLELMGADRIYDGARHGTVLEEIRRARGRGLVLLDELDKIAHNTKEGDTHSAFDSIFDDRRVLQDRFSEYDCPVDGFTFVVTCNDMSGVSEHIVDRFRGNIFTIPAYDFNKKAEVGEQFIAPKYMKKYNFTDDEVVFSKDGLLAIAKTTKDYGARNMGQQIEHLLGEVNIQIEQGEQLPIVVNEEFVKLYAKEMYSDDEVTESKKIKGFCA